MCRHSCIKIPFFLNFCGHYPSLFVCLFGLLGITHMPGTCSPNFTLSAVPLQSSLPGPPPLPSPQISASVKLFSLSQPRAGSWSSRCSQLTSAQCISWVPSPTHTMKACELAGPRLNLPFRVPSPTFSFPCLFLYFEPDQCCHSPTSQSQ